MDTNTIITDSDLLCEAGDRIDNAVFDYISATLRKQPTADALKSAFVEMLADKTVAIPQSLLDREPDFAKRLDATLKFHGVTPGPDGSIEWNMGPIGDLTDILENAMAKAGLPTCHPFEDEDECICYASESRCNYCKKAVDD